MRFNAIIAEIEKVSDRFADPCTALHSLTISNHQRATYSRWLDSVSWDRVAENLGSTRLEDDWLSRSPHCRLRDFIAKRMIRSEFAKLSITEIVLPEWGSTLKMSLTTVWTMENGFDLAQVVNNAKENEKRDRLSLLAEYHQFVHSSKCLSQAILLAVALPDDDRKSWPEAIQSVLERADDQASGGEICDTTEKVRKSVKDLHNRIKFQQALLTCVKSYKLYPSYRTFGVSQGLSLEQFIARELFGKAGGSRTQSWLRFAAEENLNLEEHVAREQFRRKG